MRLGPAVAARCLGILLLLPSVEAAAQEASDLGEAVKEGRTSLSARYRYERVDQDGFDERAHASTLRLTLGYATKPFHGVSLHVEFEGVFDVGAADAHDDAGAGASGNGVTDRPVIADPEITGLQQVFVRVASLPGTIVEGGRRELALDNERFVGPVGWRQHHQSFDFLGVTQTSIPRTTLSYHYLAKVRRVFGDTRPLEAHLAHVGLDVPSAGRLTLYGYWLDYEREVDARLSTTTLGGRFAGSRGLGQTTLRYQVELAWQRDAARNPREVDAAYVQGELGVGWKALRLGAGLEILGAGGEGAFTTPLATLHKFNGWADQFLRTPDAGLRDLFVTAGASWRGLELTAVFHDFAADAGGGAYGAEWDLQVHYATRWKQQIGVKLAVYDASGFGSDTTRLWAWTGYGF